MWDAGHHAFTLSHMLSCPSYQGKYSEVTNQVSCGQCGGMSAERTVIFVHALKNSLIPIITYGTLSGGHSTGGFVAECFRYPGLGRYFVSAIGSRDYTLIMATTIFIRFDYSS